jgi:hypothetical protein
MSDPTYNGKTYRRQPGDVFTVDSGGTLQILAGGSFQNAGGMSLGAGVSVTNLTMGGTLGRWAFGTAGLTSGVGTIATGLNRVVSANAAPVLGEAQGVGSAAFAFTDLSLSAAGSAIFRLGSVGGAVWAANGTIAWQAFGT